jgi:two-component system, chemotaxis family, protein-glutamate methylesterase/glutaminase
MIPIVVIGASAGGLEPLLRIIAAVPVPCAAAFFIVRHIGCRPSMLPGLLGGAGRLPASFALDGAPIEAGQIYVAPPDHHMVLETFRIRLSRKQALHFTRPAVDPLFVSAAEAHGQRVIGIILSGGGSDGAIGLRAIKQHGGTTIVQHPEDAAMPWMPRAALATARPDACLRTEEIVKFIGSFFSDMSSRNLFRLLPGLPPLSFPFGDRGAKPHQHDFELTHWAPLLDQLGFQVTDRAPWS